MSLLFLSLWVVSVAQRPQPRPGNGEGTTPSGRVLSGQKIHTLAADFSPILGNLSAPTAAGLMASVGVSSRMRVRVGGQYVFSRQAANGEGRQEQPPSPPTRYATDSEQRTDGWLTTVGGQYYHLVSERLAAYAGADVGYTRTHSTQTETRTDYDYPSPGFSARRTTDAAQTQRALLLAPHCGLELRLAQRLRLSLEYRPTLTLGSVETDTRYTYSAFGASGALVAYESSSQNATGPRSSFSLAPAPTNLRLLLGLAF
jgi:hypothetical protein